jgi:hypothetical protein
MIKIILSLFSGLLASIVVIICTRILEEINGIKKIIAALKALENECSYNQSHRGNSKNPFQVTWLKQALSMFELYKFCPELSKQCLNAFELAQEANIDQLDRRKFVPSNVQDIMSDISLEIKNIISNLEKQTGLMYYIFKKIKSLFYKK